MSASATNCCASLGASELSTEEAAATAAVFKALGEPSRVRLLNLLVTAAEPVCVCELTGPLGLSQPTVSHHLRKLRDAGLVRGERRGTWRYYAPEPAMLDRLARIVDWQGGPR